MRWKATSSPVLSPSSSRRTARASRAAIVGGGLVGGEQPVAGDQQGAGGVAHRGAAGERGANGDEQEGREKPGGEECGLERQRQGNQALRPPIAPGKGGLQMPIQNTENRPEAASVKAAKRLVRSRGAGVVAAGVVAAGVTAGPFAASGLSNSTGWFCPKVLAIARMP